MASPRYSGPIPVALYNSVPTHMSSTRSLSLKAVQPPYIVYVQGIQQKEWKLDLQETPPVALPKHGTQATWILSCALHTQYSRQPRGSSDPSCARNHDITYSGAQAWYRPCQGGPGGSMKILVVTWAAITKYHQLTTDKHKTLFPIVLKLEV
jgi:hypothetical protein